MLEMTIVTPPHLALAKHEDIPLNIDKENVNLYLNELWDNFEDSIGPVAGLHLYNKTNNAELYKYVVHWSQKDQDFEAELVFSNHTSKGLISASFVALDNKSHLPNLEIHKKIKNSILSAIKTFNTEGETLYYSFPLSSRKKLSGNYHLEKLDITLIANQNSADRLLFPVSAKNKIERGYKAEKTAVNILSMLTTLTQSYFDINEKEDKYCYSYESFNDYKKSMAFEGKYVTDHGFFTNELPQNGEIRQFDRGDEVIEETDCIIDDKQCLPERFNDLSNFITSNYRMMQSCKRFWEALKMRANLDTSSTSIYTVSYEIIAYIAAIEALIKSEKKIEEIKCQKCNEIAYKEEWSISKKFNALIIAHTALAPDLALLFKKVYEDRSKFVHTGIDLFAFEAYRPNRPLVLKGKELLTTMPKYYFNIHEYTGYIVRRFIYDGLRSNAQN